MKAFEKLKVDLFDDEVGQKLQPTLADQWSFPHKEQKHITTSGFACEH